MFKLSIVTVHLDDIEGLVQTRQSLGHILDSGLLEWVVVDGGSIPKSDAEKRLFESVQNTATTFVSEPDKGIYDAMNKGTRLVTGDYVLYLNAGDRLHPEFRASKLLADSEDPKPVMIWGTCHEQYPNGELVRVKTRSPAFAWYGMPVNHQNILFRRDLLGLAPYSPKYRFNADYDLLSRMLKSGGTVFRSNSPISIFVRGGLSTTNYRECLKEEASLRTHHYSVPGFLSSLTCQFKMINFRISGLSSLRKMWRRWV